MKKQNIAFIAYPKIKKKKNNQPTYFLEQKGTT